MEHDALIELQHSHNFLGDDHTSKEWRTWTVIVLCSVSMVVEIVAGILFGSLALVADGIHMSTHALAFFITASAYSYSRVHAESPRFVFGTGKVGELASFTCAIILLAIALVIVYEGIDQFINPVELDFLPALGVSFVGLSVNIASAFILGLSCGGGKNGAGSELLNHHSHGHGHGHSHGHGGHEFLKDFEDSDEEENADHGHSHGHDRSHASTDHDHEHGHDHDHGHGHVAPGVLDHGHHHDHIETFDIETKDGIVVLSIFEDGVRPEFRVVLKDWPTSVNLQDYAKRITVSTTRSNGQQQQFRFEPFLEENCLRSTDNIPEPHEFIAELAIQSVFPNQIDRFRREFKEPEQDDHAHGHEHVISDRDEGFSGSHGHQHSHDETFQIKANDGIIELSIFEENISPEFRIKLIDWTTEEVNFSSFAKQISVTTIRSNGKSQIFQFKEAAEGGFLRSTQSIPEPHEFHAEIRYQNGKSKGMELYSVDFHEPESQVLNHPSKPAAFEIAGPLTKSEKKLKYEQDNNFRAAMLHVVADAFVSVLTIIAITLAGTVNGCWFLNPLAGIVGSMVIISWGIQLASDTAITLLDMCPDPALIQKLKSILQNDGSTRVVDLHLWKLGPGKLGAIVSVATNVEGRDRKYFWNKLRKYKPLSHVTIEVYNLFGAIHDRVLTTDEVSTKNILLTNFEHDHDHDHRH